MDPSLPPVILVVLVAALAVCSVVPVQDTAAAAAAVPAPEAGRFVVRKCCAEGRAVDEKGDCVPADGSKPFKVPKFVSGPEDFEEYETGVFTVNHQLPSCAAGAFRLSPSQNAEESFRISNSGMLQDMSGRDLIAEDKYCLEQSIDENYSVIAYVCA